MSAAQSLKPPGPAKVGAQSCWPAGLYLMVVMSVSPLVKEPEVAATYVLPCASTATCGLKSARCCGPSKNFSQVSEFGPGVGVGVGLGSGPEAMKSCVSFSIKPSKKTEGGAN